MLPSIVGLYNDNIYYKSMFHSIDVHLWKMVWSMFERGRSDVDHPHHFPNVRSNASGCKVTSKSLICCSIHSLENDVDDPNHYSYHV